MDAPPIPLPSRRVGRSDGCFPGPGRPRKPGHTEDDYLAPVSVAPAAPPPLLPPPSGGGSSRARPQRQASLGRPQDIYENKAEILQAQKEAASSCSASSLAPDITLTQLLTLGMDDLALKLNVPASKLSTMTLVQLTAYLSEYLQAGQDAVQPKSRASPAVPLQLSPAPPLSGSCSAAVFKVNFDQQTSFVAKFDDTFGEDVAMPSLPAQDSTFVANFANFNEAPTLAAPAVPSADRYAVFREIIDQELQQQQQETDLMGDLTPPPVEEQEQLQGQVSLTQLDMDAPVDTMDMEQVAPPPAPPKIDTKITEVVAQAKDRYAALRDIILVENLFDKPPATAAAPVPLPAPVAEKDLLQDLFSDEFNEDQDIRQILDSSHDRRGLVDSRGLPAEPSSSALTVADDDDDDDDAGGESSMDSNEKDAEPVSAQDQYEKLSTSADKAEFKSEEQLPPKQDNKFLTVVGGAVAPAGRDDIEIDELMQRAISNLSLDSRDRISPATSSAAPSRAAVHSLHTPLQSQFNDVSTSPIPLQKCSQAGPSPVPSQLSAVSQLIDSATKQIQSERERERERDREKPPSWATFDSPKVAASLAQAQGQGKGKARLTLPPPPASNTSQQDTAESPCSSDPRDDAGGGGGGWSKQQQQRRWAKKERQQTSSSSRDLSPWDDDTPEYLKQQRGRGLPPPPTHPHAPHGYYMRHARRLNSCDEDYE